MELWLYAWRGVMCNERLWNYALSYGCMHGGVICDERLEEKSLRPNRVVRHCTPLTPLRSVDAAPPGGGVIKISTKE